MEPKKILDIIIEKYKDILEVQMKFKFTRHLIEKD